MRTNIKNLTAKKFRYRLRLS